MKKWIVVSVIAFGLLFSFLRPLMQIPEDSFIASYLPAMLIFPALIFMWWDSKREFKKKIETIRDSHLDK